MKKKSLVQPGYKFGLLTVIRHKETKGGTRYYLCECDCGRRTVVTHGNLSRGRTKSCGNRQQHPTSHVFAIGREQQTRKWLKEVSGYSYGYICQLLSRGVSPEEISMGKGIRKRPSQQRKKRIVPLFGFRTVKELADSLGLTPSRLYQKYQEGFHLIKSGKEIHFVKK